MAPKKQAAAKQFFFFYDDNTEDQLPAYRGAAAGCVPPLSVKEVATSGGDADLQYWGGVCTVECVVVAGGKKQRGSCEIFPEQLCSYFSMA